jgi:hypothetical protein
MSTHRGLKGLVCAGLIFVSNLPADAENRCYGVGQSEIGPGAWQTVKAYFASLSLTDEASRDRSRLLQLRAAIIDLEASKAELIEALEARIDRQQSPTVGPAAFNLTPLIQSIDRLTDELASIARDGSMFVAERTFKDLMINLPSKKLTLCDLIAGNPTLPHMREIVRQMKLELTAITEAEEALGKYIKERYSSGQ